MGNLLPCSGLGSWLWTLILALSFIAISASGQIHVGNKTHVVFLISEDPDNYRATETIPVFAKKLSDEHGLRTTVLLGKGERSAFRFPGFDAIRDADLVVVFCRRVALPQEQIRMLRQYLGRGKPLIGIRTAHHAFSPREPVAPGHEAWPAFPADVLGCENRGYGPTEPGMDVSLTAAGRDHAITRGIQDSGWHSDGNLYHVAPLLDEQAVVLVEGNSAGRTEPIAWTRKGRNDNRIFYTSLGYPADFENAQFNTLIINAISWATQGGRP